MVEDLSQSVRTLLAASPYPPLRGIICDVRGRTVTLRGSVRSFFLKQMAQHLVGQLGEIERVHNELQVA